MAVGQAFSTRWPAMSAQSYVDAVRHVRACTLPRSTLQADSRFRLRPQSMTIRNLKVRAGNGAMTPIGTAIEGAARVTGPPLISLYNLYPTATVVGSPAPGFSSGQALDLMEQVAAQALPTGTGFDWTAMSYQEKTVTATRPTTSSASPSCSSIWCWLDGPGSWILPFAVILAVPVALRREPSPGAGCRRARTNNLYTQIGIVLLIALGGKERDPDRRMCARAASCCGPFQFIDGGGQRRRGHTFTADRDDVVRVHRWAWVPLLSWRRSAVPRPRGIAGSASSVFGGMIASTCLAVVFVPVVLRGDADRWRSAESASPRRRPTAPLAQPNGRPALSAA